MDAPSHDQILDEDLMLRVDDVCYDLEHASDGALGAPAWRGVVANWNDDDVHALGAEPLRLRICDATYPPTFSDP